MTERMGAYAESALKGRPHDAVTYGPVKPLDFDAEDERPVVKIKVAYAPIHPSDCNVLEGTYFNRVKYYPSEPLGYEGCGIVTALSKGAAALGTLKEGDYVIGKMGSGSPMEGMSVGKTGGYWATEIIAAADGLAKVPSGLSAQQAALVGVNPATAYCLLQHAGVKLAPGSWVIQNLGNSAVGLAVCMQAKQLGYKTCSIVRREDAKKAVEDAGGDVVVVVKHDAVDRSQPSTAVQEEIGKQIAAGAAAVKEAVAKVDDKAQFVLAIDGAGGASAGVLLKSLSTGGTMLTYGNMSRESIEVGGGQLIFKQVRLQGFILWTVLSGPRALTQEQVDKMYESLFAGQMASDTPVAQVYPLAEIKDAVKHAFGESRGGKILVKCNEDIE